MGNTKANFFVLPMSPCNLSKVLSKWNVNIKKNRNKLNIKTPAPLWPVSVFQSF